MVTPRIAFGLCTHNHAGTIVQCLQSIYDNCAEPDRVEVRVFDNASSDGSYSLACGTPHFNYSKVNLGESVGRYRSLRDSRAPLLCCLDPDVEIKTPAIDLLLEKLLATRDVVAYADQWCYAKWGEGDGESAQHPITYAMLRAFTRKAFNLLCVPDERLVYGAVDLDVAIRARLSGIPMHASRLLSLSHVPRTAHRKEEAWPKLTESIAALCGKWLGDEMRVGPDPPWSRGVNELERFVGDPFDYKPCSATAWGLPPCDKIVQRLV